MTLSSPRRGAAVDRVDLLARNRERRPQLGEGLHLRGAPRRTRSQGAAIGTRPRYVEAWSQPCGPEKSTTRRAARKWRSSRVASAFDLAPGLVGDGRERTVEVVHDSPLRLPIDRLPSPDARRAGAAGHLALVLARQDRPVVKRYRAGARRTRGRGGGATRGHRRMLVLVVAIVREHRGELGSSVAPTRWSYQSIASSSSISDVARDGGRSSPVE